MAAKASNNIVIVGAGIAGVQVWNALRLNGLNESNWNVVLVNPSKYYFHRIAGVRAAVTTDGNFHERAWAELKEEKFNSGSKKLVTGSATRIEENHDGTGTVTLDNGVQVPYTYLVLATGSSWDGHLAYPSEKSGAAAWSASWRAKFERSERIVLVGGGALSIGRYFALWPTLVAYFDILSTLETAGEIKETYPVCAPLQCCLLCLHFLL